MESRIIIIFFFQLVSITCIPNIEYVIWEPAVNAKMVNNSDAICTYIDEITHVNFSFSI